MGAVFLLQAKAGFIIIGVIWYDIRITAPTNIGKLNLIITNNRVLGK